MSSIHSQSRGARIAGRARSFTIAAAASLLAAGGAGLATASAASAASLPPTVTSAFTPNLIGFDDSSATAISFTITNPNASGSLSAVALTDTLPAGLTVDDPNGENGTCGSAAVITATPGSGAISLAGGSLKAATSCTFSVSLSVSSAGTFTNTTGLVSSSAGSSAVGNSQTLTVLPPPTVTVSHIKNNARYSFGEVVRPVYTCAQPVQPTQLADCSAEDDLGNDVAAGTAINTRTPGPHSLTVSASSADGLVTTQEIDYTVLPDNRFTLAKLVPKTGGAISFRLKLPGAGKLTVLVAAANRTIASYSRTVTAKRTLNLTVPPSTAGRALLVTAGSEKVTLKVTYTPKGGVKRTLKHPGIVLRSA